MILEDDRTAEFKATPHIIIMGTDRLLSGWGGAQGGPSFAGWACRVEDEYTVDRWVRRRGDMLRVRTVGADYRPKAGPGHCHIYMVHPNHPALR